MSSFEFSINQTDNILGTELIPSYTLRSWMILMSTNFASTQYSEWHRPPTILLRGYRYEPVHYCAETSTHLSVLSVWLVSLIWSKVLFLSVIERIQIIFNKNNLRFASSRNNCPWCESFRIAKSKKTCLPAMCTAELRPLKIVFLPFLRFLFF